MHFPSIKPRIAHPTGAALLPLPLLQPQPQPQPPPKPGPRAVSIVELIIAITIFLVLITTGLTLVGNVSKAAKKVEMAEYLTTESQILLERIARQIQNSAIDYEEYYSHDVLGAASPTTYTYGTNYGEYHKQFFHPGYAPPTPPGPDSGYGAYCSDQTTSYDPDDPTSCTPLLNTFDFETGAHPYESSSDTPDTANAFCETPSASCSTDIGLYETNELYLINKAGNQKYILALEEDAIAIVLLDGTDSDGDGIMDSWACAAPEFACGGPSNLPTTTDLTNGIDSDDFIPYSPQNISIQWIKFYISPLEDPFKGYNETTASVFQSVQQQPRVTIVMNAKYQLYDKDGSPVDFSRTQDYIGAPPEVTFQTTVGTGVNQEIQAYAFP